MDQRDDELIAQLRSGLEQQGYKVAIDQEPEPTQAAEPENPLETDFFKAINAFRAARAAGDEEQVARAEEHLREVVRSELTGE